MEELKKAGFKRYLILHHGYLIRMLVTNDPDALSWYRNRKGYTIVEKELKEGADRWKSK